MAPFAASLIDRYGLRRVILSAVFLIGVGLLLALPLVWSTTGPTPNKLLRGASRPDERFSFA